MIHSMTGFASASQEVAGGSLSLEIRSVNHRYLEIQFRLDEALRPAEAVLREAISRRIQRGKVECRAVFIPGAADDALAVDQALLQRLVALGTDIQRLSPELRPLSVADLLRWPGVCIETRRDPRALCEALPGLAARVLDELGLARQREGDKLGALLRDRVAAMRRILADLAPALPRIRAAWSERIRARMAEALAQVDQERLHQELALFAQKMDVDEELSRLTAHLDETLAILDRGGAVGKRLDFLMQELNREANTLGSKSVAAETTRASMDLKVLIEQMREQIQNIE